MTHQEFKDAAAKAFRAEGIQCEEVLVAGEVTGEAVYFWKPRDFAPYASKLYEFKGGRGYTGNGDWSNGFDEFMIALPDIVNRLKIIQMTMALTEGGL